MVYGRPNPPEFQEILQTFNLSNHGKIIFGIITFFDERKCLTIICDRQTFIICVK